MNILICVDSFKDSLTSREVSSIISNLLVEKFPKSIINCVAMADGGEGSLDALASLPGGELITDTALDALLRPISANFLLYPNEHHAVIELAQTCGLALLETSDRNCFYTSTYGIGLQIKNAIEKGARAIDLLIGGSSTNDLGLGMAAALNNDFYVGKEKIKYPAGKDMKTISKIVNRDNRLQDMRFNVVTDVNNILLGSQGAVLTYGLQKGASEAELVILEAGAENVVSLVTQYDSKNYHLREGAGAAGGVGYGAMAFLGASKVSGIDYMIDRLDLDQKIEDADLVITGEGKIDSQTIHGKLVSGICNVAKAKNKAVISVCAINELTNDDSSNLGLKAIHALYDTPPERISKNDTLLRLKYIAGQIIEKHLLP